MNRLGECLRTTCAVVVVAACIGMLAACGGERAVASMRPVVATTTAPPPTEAPAPTPTEAPAPAPTPTDAPTITTAPAPDGAVEDDGDSSNVLTIVLIIAGAALALFVIAAVLSKSKSKTPTRSGRPPAGAAARPPSPQTSLLSTSQWINDQLSLELMAASPEAAAQRWSIERSRLDNVAIGAQQQFLQTGRADWQLLGHSTSALAMALDTNVQLRTQSPPNADLIGESITVVNRQRAELRQLIVAMQPTIER